MGCTCSVYLVSKFLLFLDLNLKFWFCVNLFFFLRRECIFEMSFYKIGFKFLIWRKAGFFCEGEIVFSLLLCCELLYFLILLSNFLTFLKYIELFESGIKMKWFWIFLNWFRFVIVFLWLLIRIHNLLFSLPLFFKELVLVNILLIKLQYMQRLRVIRFRIKVLNLPYIY